MVLGNGTLTSDSGYSGDFAVIKGEVSHAPPSIVWIFIHFHSSNACNCHMYSYLNVLEGLGRDLILERFHWIRGSTRAKWNT
jgi:hypothetical protein